jgi:PKD repeat protein
MTRRNRWFAGLIAVAVVALGLPALGVSAAQAAVTPQTDPLPNQHTLVPSTPRTNTPTINNGEIWDIEVIGNRVFIAGSFTSIVNNTANNKTSYNQKYLASYNIDTGLVDTSFRPTFNGGVAAVEASTDGTKLFVGGSFNTVNGVAEQKVASLNLTTGAPLSTFNFSKSTNNAVTALAASNSTLYVGGRFTRINGVLESGLAAVNTSTGVVDTTFTNTITGGVGVNGALDVQQLKLTHDESKLLVLHTGRQIDGQDRMGVGIISTQTKQLLPWHSSLWSDNIARVGGVIRVYAMDVSPDDSYFVVTAGSGGDAPPISDTAVALPVNGGADPTNVQPLWISRNFDSVYSVAITEDAVYIGGHFQFNDSPTADVPYPGLTNVGYGTGQGLGGYALGDQVVRRDHLGALDPANGRALEWDPGSNSFEGNKALLATPRGLFSGGDAKIQGGVKTGDVAFFDYNSVPADGTTTTTITAPIMGRVVPAGTPFSIQGAATSPQGVKKVSVQVKDTSTGQWLQSNGTTWGKSYAFTATLDSSPAATKTRNWSLNLNIASAHVITVTAWTTGINNGTDVTKATKKIETFNYSDQAPTANVTGPSGIQSSTSFTVTGTASDDHGVNSMTLYFRDANNNYLQPDGSAAPIFNTFRVTPDVIGATAATWSYGVTLPYEGVWTVGASANDTSGQSSLRDATRDITVNSNAVAPIVSIGQPVAMTPPFSVPNVVVQPGSPITFSGTASDDGNLHEVDIYLSNSTTRENLGADGTWGVGITSGAHRISPVDIGKPSYNWSYTTPFNLTPGTYSFIVGAVDEDGLTTSSSNYGRLTVVAQVPGDLPPTVTLSPTGTIVQTTPGLTLGGTANDDKGVSSVKATVFNSDTGQYLQANGTLSSTYTKLNATVTPGTGNAVTWSLPVTLPASGSYSVQAFAIDSATQQNTSTPGTTATYKYYPNDAAPTFDATLGQPVSGSAFTDGVIVATGRAIDDISIASVGVGIVNSAGQYMNSSGGFTSTTPSFRTAFLNSPGSAGSNFSYTTPVIPDGTYTVIVQGTDNHGQISAQRISTGVTVTHPANVAPVANATVSCQQNVCSFNGQGTTDDDTSTLTYSWNFGTGQGTGSGTVPKHTYTVAGTFSVVLTVKDYWGLTSTFTLPVTIGIPAGNVAPAPVFATNCIALSCATSSAGTADPNTGDTIAYSWNFGDGSAAVSGTNPTHVYATPGTYTVTLTTTDGWGAAASVAHTVTMTEPAGNAAPTVAFTTTCTGLVCQTNSFGTSDPDGDQIKYSWNFGDGTAASTAASPAHTYAVAGTYTITLTVTDGWNNVGTATQQVTVPQ